MKARIFFVVLLVICAAFAGRWVTRSRHSDMNTTDEKRQSFRLDAGARVEVSGINGPVEIKIADTDTGELHITRSASSADDLEYSKISIEQTPSSLTIHGENNGGRSFWRWLWGGGGQVRQEVTLTLPGRIELLVKGVNGNVDVGEVEGSVDVEGVNGSVEVAQSFGHSEIKGVNGNVKFGVSQLGAQGMNIKGVNGNIEIRLKENIDADIEVKGHNGRLSLDEVPNATWKERENHSNASARLGAGGAPIEIKGVNGNIRFVSNAPQATAAAPASKATDAAPASPAIAPVPPPPPPAR